MEDGQKMASFVEKQSKSHVYINVDISFGLSRSRETPGGAGVPPAKIPRMAGERFTKGASQGTSRAGRPRPQGNRPYLTLFGRGHGFRGEVEGGGRRDGRGKTGKGGEGASFGGRDAKGEARRGAAPRKEGGRPGGRAARRRWGGKRGQAGKMGRRSSGVTGLRRMPEKPSWAWVSRSSTSAVTA